MKIKVKNRDVLFNTVAVIHGPETIVDIIIDREHLKERTSVNSTYSKYLVSNTNGNIIDKNTPPVVNLSSYPILDRLRNSEAVIRVQTDNAYADHLLNFKTQSASLSHRFIGWKDGTPSKIAADIIFSLLSAGGNTNIFNQTSWSNNLAWNPSCWAASLSSEFTGVPVRHLNGGFSGGGVAITRRHIYTTHHYTGRSSQTSFTFIQPDGTQVTRQVIGQSYSNSLTALYDTNSIKEDIHVYVLDNDLPESIAIYPIPEQSDNTGISWALPGLGSNQQFYAAPLVWLTPQRRAMISYVHDDNSIGWYAFGSTGSIAGEQITSISYVLAGTADWSEISQPLINSNYQQNIVGGDSGSPLFIPTPSGLVLAGIMSGVVDGGFAGGGVAVSALNQARLNACIRSADQNAGISTGYTVTVAPNPIVA